MLFTLLQENLQTALSHVQRVIPSKPQLPILSSIQMKIEKDTGTLLGTDLFVGITATLPLSSDTPGELIIPGKQFREVITSLSPGEITLEYTHPTLSITSGKTKASIQCFSNEEYPPFPKIEGGQFSLTREQLKVIEKLVAFSSSSDQTRPILTAVLFDFNEENITTVATDGFRLSVMKLPNSTSQNYTGKLLIPARALIEISRIMDQVSAEEVSLTVSEELKQVLFSLGTVEVFVRLIDGEYPPYEKILPALSSSEVVFDVKELAETIKQALIFARDSSNITHVSLSKEGVKVTAHSPSLGSFERVLELAKPSGDEGELAFNSKYLLDFLSVVDQETVWLGMSDSLKPVLFKVPEYTDFQYVVMPFKVNK